MNEYINPMESKPGLCHDPFVITKQINAVSAAANAKFPKMTAFKKIKPRET